jgi:hypothetical protein
MSKVARNYGVDFDKDYPVHGGKHDKFFVGGGALWRFPATGRSPSSPREGSY